jgi:hypothetical protein
LPHRLRGVPGVEPGFPLRGGSHEPHAWGCASHTYQLPESYSGSRDPFGICTRSHRGVLRFPWWARLPRTSPRITCEQANCGDHRRIRRRIRCRRAWVAVREW